MDEADSPWIPLSSLEGNYLLDDDREENRSVCSLHDSCTVASGVSALTSHFHATSFEKLIDVSRDGKLVTVLCNPLDGDPLWRTCDKEGALISMNFIEFETRRRYRTNGVVSRPLQKGKSVGFTMEVREAFSTCPKYIQQRTVEALHPPNASHRVLHDVSITDQVFTDEVVQFILGADTMMIATVHPQRGADSSHRGGRPGFLRVLDRKIVCWGDYVGKGMFQTLGNTAICPSVGLLFVDWARGHTLQLTGSVKVQWMESGTSLDGSDRLVVFETKRWKLDEHSCPYIWKFVSMSAHNPFLQDVEEIKKFAHEEVKSAAPLLKTKHLKDIVKTELVNIKQVTHDVKTFQFRSGKPCRIIPGQYATFTISLDHPYMRSWTLTSAQPFHKPTRGELPNEFDDLVEISVKRVDLGKTSRWLHDEARVGDCIYLMGIEGSFTLYSSYRIARQEKRMEELGPNDWKVLLLSGGIGITPFVAMERSVCQGLKRKSVDRADCPNVIHIHSEKKVDEIAFRDEMMEFAREGVMEKLVFCITREEVEQRSEEGNRIEIVKGRLDLKMLQDRVPDIKERVIYICGPGPFNDAVISYLQELQVSSRNILTENFDY